MSQLIVKLTFVFSLLILCLAALIPVSSPTANSLQTHRSKIAAENAAFVMSGFNISAKLPPPHFNIDISLGIVSLSSKGCFYFTIRTLYALTRVPFDSRSRFSMVLQFPEFPDIALSLTGPYEGGGYDTRYIVWGLALAAKYMVNRNSFRDWYFTLRLQDAVKGTIWYHQSPYESIETNTSLPGLDSDDQNALVEFSIVDLPTGYELDFNDVMMVIIGGLTDVAPHDIQQRVRGNYFRTEFPPFRAEFDLRAATARAVPPIWFTYDIVRQALARLALWYMQGQICKPARITMMINGVHVGYGDLMNI